MNKKVVFYTLALDALIKIYNWYDQQQHGLAQRFLTAFSEAVKLISQYPEGFQKVLKNFRQAMIRGFPYLIIYINDPHEVVVYNVIDARQLPSKRYPKRK